MGPVTDSTEPGRPGLRVYSKPGCHLCEILIEELLPLIRGHLDLEVVDIESRPDWLRDYGTRIPVVEFNSETVCQYKLDTGAILKILADHAGSQT
jgi:hypothetical protein